MCYTVHCPHLRVCGSSPGASLLLSWAPHTLAHWTPPSVDSERTQRRERWEEPPCWDPARVKPSLGAHSGRSLDTCKDPNRPLDLPEKSISFSQIKSSFSGFPRWCSGKPMQRTGVQFLVQEDPTYCEATTPVRLDPTLYSKRSHHHQRPTHCN